MAENINVGQMTLQRLDTIMDLINITPDIKKYSRQSRKVLKHKKKAKTIKGYKNVQDVRPEELLTFEFDILILAALENKVNESNADKVKAGFIAEVANVPITPGKKDIFLAKGIFIIPGIRFN